MTLRSSPEFQIQRAVVQHLMLRRRKGVSFMAIPNGEYRSKRTAGRLKAAGVRAGAPDMLVIVDGRPYGLEIKTETGRMSPDQRAMQQEWREAMAVYHVAHGLDEALRFLEDIGAITSSRGRPAVREAAE